MILEDLKRMFHELTLRDWLELAGWVVLAYLFMFLGCLWAAM